MLVNEISVFGPCLLPFVRGKHQQNRAEENAHSKNNKDRNSICDSPQFAHAYTICGTQQR